jgi:cytoskeletal protein CcmA (bactofilin family)
MFNKRKKQKTSRISTVIGEETEVHGDIIFGGGLHIDGTVKGNVAVQGQADAMLTVSELGVVEGDIKVPNIVLNGKVSGDVYSSGHLELAEKAEINGNVYYSLLEMSMGASVNGSMVHSIETMKTAVPVESASEEVDDDNRIKLD